MSKKTAYIEMMASKQAYEQINGFPTIVVGVISFVFGFAFPILFFVFLLAILWYLIKCSASNAAYNDYIIKKTIYELTDVEEGK